MPDPSCSFYVTTPIYYVNARPHIGHAYTTIVADVLARRARAQGTPTWFLTGTDEHGQKIERSALAAGIPPQTFTDQVSASFRDLWKRMGITNDQYIRTTDEAHKKGVQKLFADLHAKGQIYLSTYTGQYSIGEEMFVEGPPGTIGPDGKPTETVTEENFFFRLSDYQLPLLNLIESDTLKITPEARKNEVLSFLRGNTSGAPGPDSGTWVSTDLKQSAKGILYLPGALKDLSVSRSSFTWGIPVPEPAASEAKEKHVIYVWLDALANYITALGYGSDDTTQFEKFWPADIHLVGKEIIRFHCVYWPAFLLAAGLDLPKAVTAHGWLLFDDSKMSKSKGNIVRTETILDAFGTLLPPPAALTSDALALGIRGGLQPPVNGTENEGALAPGSPTPPPEPTKQDQDLFAADVLRYFLLREIPFGQDGSFTFEALITRYNADLANGYGNLVSRTLNMIHKYFDGVVPPSWVSSNSVVLESSVKESQLFDRFVNDNSSGTWVTRLPSEAVALSLAVGRNTQLLRFNKALEACSELIRLLDSDLTSKAPWKVIVGLSDDEMQEKRASVLYTAAESIRIITALLHPILPYATAKVWHQLGLGDIELAAANGELKNLTWGGLQPGTKLGPLSPIFPRADKGLAQTMSDMEQEKSKAPVSNAPVSKLVDEKFNASPETPQDPTHPGAPPRAFGEATTVAGSNAHSTERPGTPPHAEAASGIFSAPFMPESNPGMSGSTPAAGPADASPQITIDDFAKIELRVAQILVCERIPKADKLLRLEVDLGYEKRQILSGIAEWYTPEDLIGRRIVVITNLAPRKMRGLESHGMLLAASTEGGKPHLATFAGADDLPLGSRLK
ncbi:methionine--tRNA ligase subunit beta [Granulicella tundricola]|uniref:Methionine--tRNA ligase n=1 Tax=Granulicella tundricola (strain ATCC BAA-1859 / DSM 23138 / MP5ACTX9) TaxID=1198114 RepID=E8X3N9_GRATM|nr:methionine--tRNA ligase subunit beta [Granulicella tundricola]ADW68230.1 methionyl-tRNA synthetase [Granulicella tundricola MP5ACTX9]